MVSNLLFAVGHEFGPLVFALIMSGLGFGMVRPGYAAAASLAVEPHEQGAVAGLTGATSGAGFIFGPVIATALYRIAPQRHTFLVQFLWRCSSVTRSGRPVCAMPA